MNQLHDIVLATKKDLVIKESEGFRLRMEKWEVINPKGLYAVNLIQESFDEDGEVWHTSTYNFNMTAKEIQALAGALTV
jgi:hypothetical protein